MTATQAAGTTWWTGVPAVEATIDCQGATHRLCWDDGALSTPDHADIGHRLSDSTGDPARSPSPKSARPPADEGCALVARSWQTFRHDPRTLVLGRRHPGETLNTQVAEASGDALAGLLALLDPALERRLQLEAATALGETWKAGTGDGAVLEAATVGRVAGALDRWLGPGKGPSVRLGRRSTVSEEGGRPVLTLAPTWLGQVWGRYLTLVEGFLVLDVLRIVENRAEVIGIGRLGGDPARLTLAGPLPWRPVGRQPL